MKTIISLTIVIIACFNIIALQKKEIKECKDTIAIYHNYYENTENFLDTLETQYNWVDAVDNYNYYSSRDKVEKTIIKLTDRKDYH